MRRAMCIWIPDWPVQRLALARPELHGRTVVLYETSPQGGLKVVAATPALGLGDYAAGFTAGIYPGMPLAEAAALVAHAVGNALCGVPESPKDIAPQSKAATSLEPHLEPADPDADYLALVQWAEWCQQFSPITGVEDAPRPDCLLLDVTGLGHLFGGEQALAEEVHRAFAACGLSVRVAVADTIGAAWAAVHAEAVERTDFSVAQAFTPGTSDAASTIDAPLGAEAPAISNKNGHLDPGINAWAREKVLKTRSRFIHILSSGEMLAALSPLPIGYLRVAEETATLLATLGIYRVGQLATLPRSSLLSRFGPDLLLRLDQALGRAPEMIVARHIAPLYAADFTFEAPLANREAIEHVLGQLIARLTEPLSRRREGVLSLLCRLKYERAFEEDIRPERPKGNNLDCKVGLRRTASPLAQAFTPATSSPRRGQTLVAGSEAPGKLRQEPADPEGVEPGTGSTPSGSMRNAGVQPGGVAAGYWSATPPALDVGFPAKQQQSSSLQPSAEQQGVNAWATEKSSLAFCVGLFRASASAEYLCDLLRLRLESVRMAGLVTSVQVEVTAIGPLELRQQALFDSDSDQDQPRRLAALVDRLNNRLGREAVVQTMLLADAQPEYTCVDLPLTPTANPQKKNAKKNLAHVRRYGLLSFGPDERPLELLRQPARVEIVAVDPRGAPAQFRFAGGSYAVAYAWGPERIETGWWRTARGEQERRKTFVRRDYYRVETITGARFWIFRQLGSPQWFLHGRF